LATAVEKIDAIPNVPKAMALEKAGEAVADVAEAVADEATDIAEAARTIDSRSVGMLLGGATLGVGIGAAAAYFVLKTRLQTKYEQIAEEEISGMREHYLARVRALENEREKEKLDEVREEIQTRQEANEGEGQTPYHTFYQGGSEPDKVPGEDSPVVQNVFVNNGDDPEVDIKEAWDYEVETRQRSEELPYVIHRDEYNNETPDGFDQYTLTYFEGDDVLCRDDDTVIDDQDSVVGLGNLTKFGHGSGDPNIVYVRNHELRVDLEVVHSDGKYATEVHGFQDDELQHSSMRRRSPRRSEYDDSDR